MGDMSAKASILFLLILLIQLELNEADEILFHPQFLPIPTTSKNYKVLKILRWHIDLEEDQLLSGSVKWFSGGEEVRRNESRCIFSKGFIWGSGDKSWAAVSECKGGVWGYMEEQEGSGKFFHPIKEGSSAHLLYTSWEKPRKQRSAEPQSPPPWLFNLTGDTISIGEEEIETELNRNYSFNLSIDPSPFKNNLETLFVVDSEENGYFVDSAWSTATKHPEIPRHPHPLLPPTWLELAVGVDHTVINFHGRNKVEEYILALLNIVSAIYQDPSLEGNMKLVVSRLIFYEGKKQSVVRAGNSKKSLENVNSWNKRLYSSLGFGETRHDVAVWITRMDIGGPSGYAPVSGACDPKRSCALNKDEGLSSAFIIAHEIAHILGLSHDGDKKSRNDCHSSAAEGSVMAPMVAATFNKFFWSECSKREFRKNIPKWTCLSNPPTSNSIQLNATLQNFFSMDEQCRMEFGEGYGMCRAFDIIEPCSHLWCGHKDSPLVCKTKKGPPLEGTDCGFGKWCVNGYCEDVSRAKPERVPVVLNPQDGRWGDWGPWGPCSRTCGMGAKFRERKCNNPEPSYGGKNCEGAAEEWKICGELACPEPGDFRAQQCARLPKLVDFEGSSMANLTWLPYESEEEETKCKLICISEETKDIYVTNEFFIDGTKCSYDYSNKICVQGKCESVGCDGQLGSGAVEDSCGVCKGNSSDCVNIRRKLKRTLKKEVSRLIVLPRLSREVKIEANVTFKNSSSASVAFIIKNRRKKKFIITIPNSGKQAEIIEGAQFYYEKYDNFHKLRAKGPVLSEMVILVYSNKVEIGKGITISVEYSYFINMDALVPSKRYVWILGGWGPCSASCGGGKRQKTTACWDNHNKKIVRRKFCSLLEKPTLDTESCNSFSCNFEWIAGEWEPCSAICGNQGTQNRELYCVPKLVLTKMLFHNNGTILDQIWKYMVSPEKCPKSTLSSERPCNRFPCQIEWTFEDWSSCSTSCGLGVQTRSFKCIPYANETLYTCGKKPEKQERYCKNLSGKRFCKIRKCEDKSDYCNLEVLHKYCILKGFNRICCKSCSLSPVSF